MSQETWRATEAEIVSCKIAWLASHYGNIYEGVPGQTEYTAECVYEVAGTIYRQKMRAYNPDCTGDKFELLYDPANPVRNNAPDQLLNPRDWRSWRKHLIIWCCGILLAFVINHFWPNTD